MGIFKRTKKVKNQPADVAQQVFDEQYREELRQMGRDHFQRLLDESSSDLKQDVDSVLEQLNGSLRRHMATQLDLAITRINNDISSQFKEKMNEYNRVSGEAQELVVQSLSRNAQSVHEKYQQMATNLQQVVANQEVMMVGVFQDNQNRVAAAQSEQDRAMEQLRSSIDLAQRQHSEIVETMRRSAEEQSQKINEVYRENIDKTSAMKQSQEDAIRSLASSVESLQAQHAKLQQLLDESILKHKTMALDLINQNMARIVEHYLKSVLGESADISRDLPNIIKRMEENKQAMMDDISL